MAGMTEHDEGDVMGQPTGDDALSREYLAGRITADAYVAAGGDPDVVRDTETRRASEAADKRIADERATTRTMLGCLAIPVVLVGGCFAAGALAGSGGGSSRADTAQDLSFSARSTCETAVEQQLKDPGSAEYSDVAVTVTDAGGPDFGYEVIGTVRAGNSFGGMAVHSFDCTATYTGSDETMRARARIS